MAVLQIDSPAEADAQARDDSRRAAVLRNRETTPLPLAADQLADVDAPARSAFGLRGIAVGLVAVILICGLTPLNDFALSDTSLSAGFLPVGAVLFLFGLVVFVNAPLHRWAPRHALTKGELAIVTLMALLASSLPNWGMMKFFIPLPVAPFRLGQTDAGFWHAFQALQLPAWLFPVADPANGRNDPIVVRFFSGIPDGVSVPLSQWGVPLLAWGVFIVAMVATLVAIARILIHQWMNNERLPFPLVEVQAALIDQPLKGRSFNEIFRSRFLWIGLISVFAIHSLTTANSYLPSVPRVTLEYNFSELFADPPFAALPTKVKAAKLSFMVIGATFFIRSRVAFSVFGIFLLVAISQVMQSSAGIEPNSLAQQDQHLGACAAFVLGIFWIGRHHWAMVIRNAFGVGRSSDYRTTFWIAVAGVGVMLGWLWFVGVQPWMAGLIVLFILGAHVVVSRVVAETGLPFYRSSMAVGQVYSQLPIGAMTGRSVFMANVFTVMGPLTTRDGVMGFAMQGYGTANRSGIATEEPRNRRWLATAVIAAFAVGLPIAAASTLFCHYTFATPPSAEIVPQGNYFGAEYIPQRDVANPFNEYTRGRFNPRPHEPLVHMGIGFGITAALQVCVLRFAGWPLLPVGFVTSHGAFVANAWFSIAVGWLAKVLIVRLGGASLYTRLVPLFLGVILGEALAAGALLLVNAIVVMNGYESQTVRFLL